jgi:hypothetical protein
LADVIDTFQCTAYSRNKVQQGCNTLTRSKTH